MVLCMCHMERSRDVVVVVVVVVAVVAIVVELGQEALGEGPPDVTDPDELGWKQIEESAEFCLVYRQPSPQRSSESEVS